MFRLAKSIKSTGPEFGRAQSLSMRPSNSSSGSYSQPRPERALPSCLKQGQSGRHHHGKCASGSIPLRLEILGSSGDRGRMLLITRIARTGVQLAGVNRAMRTAATSGMVAGTVPNPQPTEEPTRRRTAKWNRCVSRHRHEEDQTYSQEHELTSHRMFPYLRGANSKQSIGSYALSPKIFVAFENRQKNRTPSHLHDVYRCWGG